MDASLRLFKSLISDSTFAFCIFFPFEISPCISSFHCFIKVTSPARRRHHCQKERRFVNGLGFALCNAARSILTAVYIVRRTTQSKPGATHWDPLSELSFPSSAPQKLMIQRCNFPIRIILQNEQDVMQSRSILPTTGSQACRGYLTVSSCSSLKGCSQQQPQIPGHALQHLYAYDKCVCTYRDQQIPRGWVDAKGNAAFGKSAGRTDGVGQKYNSDSILVWFSNSLCFS